MSRDSLQPISSALRPRGAPTTRSIATGAGWSIGEFICTLGPEDRRFEERHERVAISAVVEGSFQYRSTTGRALLYPGSFMLGNAGACYECGHEHGRGDRCIAFHFDSWVFEEIAADVAGSARFRFPASMLPATRELAATFSAIEIAAHRRKLADTEELAFQVIENVLIAASGGTAHIAAPAVQDQRRVSRVLRYMEAHSHHLLDLPTLAGMACASKYHFLRTFRRVVGVTPHQYLIGLRMRRAVKMLCTTSMPIASIAYEVGFGDLSTFNGHFRERYGVSPGAYRRKL